MEVGELDEVSGVLVSRTNDETLWVHEDRGAGPTLYALNLAGFERSRYTLAGAQSYDWEDISFGPGPIAGRDYLYVADFGDNNQSREDIVIHRVAEPTDIVAGSHELPDTESFTFTYPADAENAEALLVDPITGDLTIIAKTSGTARIYAADAPLSPESSTVLRDEGSISFGLGALATGADISADGTAIVVRTYGDLRAWHRDIGVPVWDAVQEPHCTLAATAENQGEAIAIAADGQRFITISEGTYRAFNWYTVIP